MSLTGRASRWRYGIGFPHWFAARIEIGGYCSASRRWRIARKSERDAFLSGLAHPDLCGANFGHSIWTVTKTSFEARSRIDEFLPNYDFCAAYQMRINAAPSAVWECLLHLDFGELWLTRFLMTLRTGKRMPRHGTLGDLRQPLQGTGFVILEEAPEDELVIGLAGRFWRHDGGRCMDLTADNFIEFSRTGHAKVAMNLKLRAETPETETTVLSTETRIQCFGPAALWKFRLYWAIVGPFSGLIRKAILQHVKTKAAGG